MNVSQQQLWAWLGAHCASDFPLGPAYAGAPDFVMKHGQWFEADPYPRMPRGAQLQCFGNSIVLGVLYGHRYVEGYALSPAGQVIHHGWNSDDGRLVDSTWLNTGLAYIGVEFSVGRGDDATWNGDASVLDDHHRGHPLFAEPWEGEDFDRYWPSSEGMASIEARIEQLGGPAQARQFCEALRVPVF